MDESLIEASGERVDHHAVAELGKPLWNRLGEDVRDLAVSGGVDEYAGAIGDELFELVVFDVDVLHAPMQNWIFRGGDAAEVVFVELSWDLVVEELLRKLGRRNVGGDEEAVHARGVEVGELSK